MNPRCLVLGVLIVGAAWWLYKTGKLDGLKRLLPGGN